MKKEKIFDYLFQLVIVVLGVFLGMLASDWSAQRDQTKYEKDIMLSIEDEINANLTYLEANAVDQKRFFKSLDSLTKALENQPVVLNELFHDKPFLERIPNWPGLGKTKLYDAMFEAAKSSNILPHLEVDLLQQLSKNYNLQSNVDETRGILGQEFFRIDATSKYSEVVDFMWIVMQDYFGANYNLIKEYKKTLVLIKKYYPNKS